MADRRSGPARPRRAGQPRWIYAVACLAGLELGPAAVHAGCEAFGGYEQEIRIGNSLSQSDVAALFTIIEVAVDHFRRGVFDQRAIGRQAFLAYTSGGFAGLPDERFFVQLLAEDLLELRVHSPPV